MVHSRFTHFGLERLVMDISNPLVWLDKGPFQINDLGGTKFRTENLGGGVLRFETKL